MVFCKAFREFGPQTLITEHASVTSSTSTEPSSGRCMIIHPRSLAVDKVPVVTRNACSPIRVIVTSHSIPPALFRNWV